MGKQGKMKEAYQEAVMKSESSVNLKKEEIQVCDTKTIKERFEKGEVTQETIKDGKDEEDQEVFKREISKKSRSLFLQLDANASKPPQMSPVSPPKLEVKKAREGSTPERELYHDPDIVRAEEVIEDSIIAKETHTATKMLNKFRQMEENMSKEPTPQGPKPLKRFTPPPEPTREEESSGEEGSETDDEVEEVDHTKAPDEDLIEAQKAARAKLRALAFYWHLVQK
ncbi:hypothetical protein HHI36_007553 [Cryptolaemus montrouzieri]|uniref:Uncharacterized protein n=1 Tax=Cryptolaemus montrouzieri TaxID=559131 RepID=A0ABD2MQ13_9CUCU